MIGSAYSRGSEVEMASFPLQSLEFKAVGRYEEISTHSFQFKGIC